MKWFYMQLPFQAVPFPGGGGFIGLRQFFQQQSFRLHPQSGGFRAFPADGLAFQQGGHCQKDVYKRQALHRFQMQGTRRLPERRPRVHGYIPAVFRLLPCCE